MLSETLFRVPREPGLHVLQRRGDRGARELTSSRLCLRAGASATYSPAGEETIVVLQQGRGTLCDAGADPDRVAHQRVHRTRHRHVPAARACR